MSINFSLMIVFSKLLKDMSLSTTHPLDTPTNPRSVNRYFLAKVMIRLCTIGTTLNTSFHYLQNIRR